MAEGLCRPRLRFRRALSDVMHFVVILRHVWVDLVVVRLPARRCKDAYG